jgi:uncharacterized protein (TIRG00374 family)
MSARPQSVSPAARNRSHPRARKWLRLGVFVLLGALVVEYFALPQLVGAQDAFRQVQGANGLRVSIALGLEICALLAYTMLTQAVLGGRRLSYWRQLRIDLTGYGTSHVVPGGGATAAGLRYRLMTTAGVRPADAVTCAALEGAAEFTALTLIFACGVAITAPQPGHHPFVFTSGVIAGVLTGGVAVIATALHWAPATVRRAARAVCAPIPFVSAAAVERAVDRLAARTEAVFSNRRLLAAVVGWALVNWLLDALCLWVSLSAFGYQAPIGPLLAVYGVANLVALLPITPGGLGLVEGVVIPVLVSFGSPRTAAVLGVLTWRLIAFWLPIPVSWLTAASLGADGASSTGDRSSE